MTYTNITYIFLFLPLLGAQLISVNVGTFQLSPYRLLLATAPFLLSGIFISALLKKKILIRYEYTLFLAVWFLYSIASGAWAVDHGSWARSILLLMGGCVTTIFIFAFIDTYHKVEVALKIVVLTSVAVSGLALYEIITGNYFYLSDEIRAHYMIRSQIETILGFRVPVTIFGNPNDYAVFLYISTIFCFILIMVCESRFRRFLYLVILIFFIFLLISTQSRAGILGLLVFALMYGLLYFYRAGVIKKIAAFFMGLFIVTFAVINFTDFFILVGDFLSVDLSGSDMGSDAVRRNLILNGLTFLYQSYFFGIGAGQVEEYIASSAVYPTAGITNMHNWWFEFLTTSGLFVFAIYLLVYIRTAIKALTNFLDVGGYRSSVINAAVFCFLVSFVVGSVGPSSLVQNEWIWPLLALIMKAPFICNRRLTPVLDRTNQPVS